MNHFFYIGSWKSTATYCLSLMDGPKRKGRDEHYYYYQNHLNVSLWCFGLKLITKLDNVTSIAAYHMCKQLAKFNDIGNSIFSRNKFYQMA